MRNKIEETNRRNIPRELICELAQTDGRGFYSGLLELIHPEEIKVIKTLSVLHLLTAEAVVSETTYTKNNKIFMR
jgi:hypothetical protein